MNSTMRKFDNQYGSILDLSTSLFSIPSNCIVKDIIYNDGYCGQILEDPFKRDPDGTMSKTIYREYRKNQEELEDEFWVMEKCLELLAVISTQMRQHIVRDEFVYYRLGGYFNTCYLKEWEAPFGGKSIEDIYEYYVYGNHKGLYIRIFGIRFGEGNRLILKPLICLGGVQNRN